MKVIEPVPITGARLQSSNVPDDDYDAWSSATTYTNAPGEPAQQVREGIDVYVLRKEASTNQQPSQHPDVWGLVGVINRWRMFDPLRSAQTVHDDAIVVNIRPGERVNAVALFGLEATLVTVEMFSADDELLYSRSQRTFSQKGISNWAEYFRAKFHRVTRLTFPGMPSSADGVVRITIENGSGVAACAKVVVGTSRTFGCTFFGINGRRRNHSIQERDDFGGLFLVPRRTVKTLAYTVEVKSDDLDYVDVALSRYYGYPTVFVGSDRWSFTIIYGVLMDSNPSLDGRDTSRLTLTVEEI